MICPLFLVLIIVVFSRLALLLVSVEQESMTPTLAHGDQVLVLRYWPSQWLRKGHIVLAKFEKSSYAAKIPSHPVIKRIVGLPGDSLVVSNKEVREVKYLEEISENSASNGEIVRVPLGHCFVCGDNLAQSGDSRLWGPIPVNQLLGIMIMKLRR